MLTDCIKKEPSENEILMVQSGGLCDVLRNNRDRWSQAVLEIEDWELELDQATLDQVLDSEGAKSVIAALGAGIDLGFFGIDATFHPETVRYGKILIVVRSDALGKRIKCELIDFFFRYMHALLASERIYWIELPSEEISEELLREKVPNDSTRKLNLVKLADSMIETWSLNS